MKNILFILTLLFGMLLLSPNEKEEGCDLMNMPHQKEIILNEISTDNNMQHNLEVLSCELKSSNFLTPRRVVQTISNTINVRLFKIEERTLQLFRLKEMNLLRKISEDVIICRTINVSTLLCRMGYHVYALRKIII